MDESELIQLMPLCATLGMRAVRFEPDAIELEMDWTAERCTSNGLLHGGALMALARSARWPQAPVLRAADDTRDVRSTREA